MLHDDGTGLRRDGEDTGEWVAAQSWCAGSVGVFGYSYLGQTALGAATAAPAHLRAAAPAQPAADEFTDRSFAGGVLDTNISTWVSLPMVADDLIAKLPSEQRHEAGTELDTYRAG